MVIDASAALTLLEQRPITGDDLKWNVYIEYVIAKAA